MRARLSSERPRPHLFPPRRALDAECFAGKENDGIIRALSRLAELLTEGGEFMICTGFVPARKANPALKITGRHHEMDLQDKEYCFRSAEQPVESLPSNELGFNVRPICYAVHIAR